MLAPLKSLPFSSKFCGIKGLRKWTQRTGVGDMLAAGGPGEKG